MWKFYRLSTCTAVGTLPRPEDTPSIHARAQAGEKFEALLDDFVSRDLPCPVAMLHVNNTLHG